MATGPAPIAATRRPRAMIVSPDGGHGIQLCAGIVAAMPEYDWRVQCLCTVTAIQLRRMKLRAYATPWRPLAPADASLAPEPFSTELALRGLRPEHASRRYRRSLLSLRQIALGAIEDWQPELLVCFSFELALPRQFALALSIRTARSCCLVLLQPWYVRTQVLVHDQGLNWQTKLAVANLAVGPHPAACPAGREVAAEARSTRHGHSAMLWATRAERLARGLVGAVSLDHLWRAVVTLPLRQRWWWRRSATHVSSAEWCDRCVLVAVHRPAPVGPTIDWIDLVNLAVAATDDNTTVLVRLHPAEPLPVLDRRARAAIAHPRVQVCSPESPGLMSEVLQHCIACFTIASSSGLDALRLGVPTFTLGPCHYAQPRLAHPVTAEDAPALRRHLRDLHGVRRAEPLATQWITTLADELGATLPADTAPARPAHAVADRIRALVASWSGVDTARRACPADDAVTTATPASPHD